MAKKLPAGRLYERGRGSGGYYVATPAAGLWRNRHLTGSIGVLSAKLSACLRQKLGVNTVHFRRGANASILGDTEPFTDAQRTQMRHPLRQFTRSFRAGRPGPSHDCRAVDAISGGRVWTGEQALKNGLVNQLGDLHTAIAKARELAKLPDNTPVMMIGGKVKPLPPQTIAVASYALDNARLLFNGSAQVIMPIWWKPSDGS